MADQGETNSFRLGQLQNPRGLIQNSIRSRAPGDKHAAHALQPEHAQGRGGSVLGHLAAVARKYDWRRPPELRSAIKLTDGVFWLIF